MHMHIENKVPVYSQPSARGDGKETEREERNNSLRYFFFPFGTPFVKGRAECRHRFIKPRFHHDMPVQTLKILNNLARSAAWRSVEMPFRNGGR